MCSQTITRFIFTILKMSTAVKNHGEVPKKEKKKKKGEREKEKEKGEKKEYTRYICMYMYYFSTLSSRT